MVNDAAVHGLRPFDINLIDFAKPANKIPFSLPQRPSPLPPKGKRQKKINYTRLRREDCSPEISMGFISMRFLSIMHEVSFLPPSLARNIPR